MCIPCVLVPSENESYVGEEKKEEKPVEVVLAYIEGQARSKMSKRRRRKIKKVLHYVIQWLCNILIVHHFCSPPPPHGIQSTGVLGANNEVCWVLMVRCV